MTEFAFIFSRLLGVLTVITQTVIIIVVVLWFFFRERSRNLFLFLSEYSLFIIFVSSMGGVVGSLVYSNFLGYLPCVLCWWARIFLYPIAFISATALLKNRSDAHIYLLPLALAGTLVTAYHSFIQYGGAQFIPCSAGGVSCTQRFVYEFGYITIPLMAFTSFAFILLLLLLQRSRERCNYHVILDCKT